MSFSVIIPTLNESEFIVRAIRSAQLAGAAEIIVVDGGSSDATVGLAESQGASIVHSAPGRGIQLNAAANEASQDFLLFLHADNWLSSECGLQIVKAIETGTEYFCFKQQIKNPRWIFRLIEKGNAMRALYQKLPYGDQGVAVSRRLFDRVGGFPPISLMEDVTFARKLSRLASPVLLPGPIKVSDRRWVANGVLRQTLRNWITMLRFRLGVSPDKLAHSYNHANHDRVPEKAEISVQIQKELIEQE